MKDHIPCTIYDCEFDDYTKGVIILNKVYITQEDGSYIAAKEKICEYVDHGMVQFYTGYYNETNIADGIDNISRWGYFDFQTGEVIIAPNYEYAAPFYGGLARVVKNRKVGFIDYDGNTVIGIIWDEIKWGAKSELWAVRKDNKWGYINRNGKVIISLHFDYVSLFNDNRARIKINNKWGYINITGELVIKPFYDDIGTLNCIGKDANKSYYGALVKKDDKYGFINEEGKYISKPLFEEAFEFWDIGYACVKDCGKWGIIDRTGEVVVRGRFDDIGEYYGDIGKNRIFAMRRWGSKFDGHNQRTNESSDIKDIYFTIKLGSRWGIMDTNFNVKMSNKNNNYVVFNDIKVYIKDGNVTSMRRIL